MKDFLLNSEQTGRFIVQHPSGKKYYVEPIGTPKTSFGDVNPATGKIEGSYGEKYRGSIDKSGSMLTEENGFTNVVELPAGVSPLAYIESMNKGQ